MSSKEQTHVDRTSSKQQPPKPVSGDLDTLAQQQPHPATIIQRARLDPHSLSARDVLQLQHSVGNRATTQLLAEVSARSLCPVVQPKLMVGPSDDGYEQEADRVAEQVMGMPVPTSDQQPAASSRHAVQRQDEEEIQTKPLVASITPLVQRQVDEEEIQTMSLQRRKDGSFATGPAVENRLAAHKGGGSPLLDEVRAFMEPRFGVDLSGVRVHVDGEAARLSRAVSAQAFTHGQDIYVGAGKYSPGSTAGKRLLAHELTHVVQQTGTVRRAQSFPLAGAITPRPGADVINRWDDYEHKAFGDAAAQKALTHDWKFETPDRPLSLLEKYWSKTDTRGKKQETPLGVGVTSDETMNRKDPEKLKKYQEFLTGTREGKDKSNQAVVNTTKKGYKPFMKEIGATPTQNTTVGVAHYPEGGSLLSGERAFMSMGDASMLSGDFFKSPGWSYLESAGLAQAKTVNPADISFAWMAYVASTNTNHFFPLAEHEFKANYGKALDLAAKAHDQYLQGEKQKGDALAEQALQHVGFALHFLQDTFASGHQYPRALDEIGSTLGSGGGAVYWGATAASYHDALCALPKGLPMLYGQKFHGDDFADATDKPVAEESYRALGKVLEAMTGKDLKIPEPKANEGPDVSAIMSDDEARPIWISMVKHINTNLLSTAVESAKNKWQGSTSAGTAYKAKEDVMDKLKLPKKEDQAPQTAREKMVDAALQARANIVAKAQRGPETSLAKVGASAIDQIRAIVLSDGVPKDLTHNELVLILGALLSSAYTNLADEQLINQILDAQSDKVVLGAVQEVTPEKIGGWWSSGEWDSFLALWASKGDAGNNPGADFIINKAGVLWQSSAARKLVERLHKNSQMYRLSSEQWKSMLKLLTGVSLGNYYVNKAAVDIIKKHLHLPIEKETGWNPLGVVK